MTARDREDLVHGDALRARAVQGMALLVGRTVALQALTFAGTVVLARLISPQEYGLFAVALTVQQLGRGVAEFGLAPALVRRSSEPTTHEQRAVTGVVLAAGALFVTLLGAVALVIAPALGVQSRALLVVALASVAIPVYGVRTIPIVLLERSLRFGRLATMEVAETVAFYGFAIPAAVAGWGAFALAGAVPGAALVGTVVAIALRPFAAGLSVDPAVIRPLFQFGLRVAATGPVQLAREMTLTIVLAAAGGQALAGFYNLSVRLLSLVTASSWAVQRVGFASLVHIATGPERDRRAADGAGLTALAASLPAAVVVGASAPLVETAFGVRWLPTVDVLVVAAPAVLLFSSLGAVWMSLALADGHAGLVLRAVTIQGVVAVAVACALAGSLAEVGAGLATSAGIASFCIVMALALTAGARRAVGPCMRAVLAAAAAATVGQVAVGSTGLDALAAALALSAIAWVVFAMLLTRAELVRLAALSKRYLRRGAGQPTA